MKPTNMGINMTLKKLIYYGEKKVKRTLINCFLIHDYRFYGGYKSAKETGGAPHIYTWRVLEKTSLRLYVRLHEAINANDYYSC